MPDIDVWPPKPDLPDPLMEYDEFIEAELPTLSAKTVDYDLVLPPITKQLPGFHRLVEFGSHLLHMNVPQKNRGLLLVQVLREEKGLDLWQARVIVRNYYQRHGLALVGKSEILFLVVTVALLFIASLLGLVTLYLPLRRNAILSQPNNGAALLALDNAKSLVFTALFIVLGLLYGFWLLRYWVMRLRTRKK